MSNRRRSYFIKSFRPYKVDSCADGHLEIKPHFVVNEDGISDFGVLSRMTLAKYIENLLNGIKEEDEPPANEIAKLKGKAGIE